MGDISLSNLVPFSPIAAVRNCPSGALSYAIGGVECRDEVDRVREPMIVVSKDGPYRITSYIY